ncbi:MAG: hypothetical protein Q4C68_05910, partial [Moraxella sp.]|nr:hypothetical protein [Moraxella sp.]
YIYAISETYFEQIKNDIDIHWYHYQDVKSEKERVILGVDVDKTLILYAKRLSDNKVYLNTKIIFRNEKIIVICPPDYKIIAKKPEVCFITNEEYLYLSKENWSRHIIIYQTYCKILIFSGF